MGLLSSNEGRAKGVVLTYSWEEQRGLRSLWKAVWQYEARALKQFKHLGLVILLLKNNEKLKKQKQGPPWWRSG